MNLTLGSSWPTYQPLSMKRCALPLTILIGSTHRSPASFLTVRYSGLQPLQSSSLTGFGATPAAPAARAAPAALAAAEPVRLSWATTATPSTGTSIAHHLRRPPGGEPPPDRVEDPRADHGVRMCDPSPPGAGRGRPGA